MKDRLLDLVILGLERPLVVTGLVVLSLLAALAARASARLAGVAAV